MSDSKAYMPDLNKPLFDPDVGLARPIGELVYLRNKVREQEEEILMLRRRSNRQGDLSVRLEDLKHDSSMHKLQLHDANCEIERLTNEVEHLRRYQANVLAHESERHEPGSWP